MAFQEHKSTRSANWVTIGGFTKEGEKNPSSIAGYYLGRTEGVNSFDAAKTKTTFMLNVKGKLVGVNGSTNMVIQMKDWEVSVKAKGLNPLGMMIKIEFTGTAPSKKGTPTKLYKIGYDKDDVNAEKPADTTEAPNDAADYAYGDEGDTEAAEQLIAVAKQGSDQEKIAKLFAGKKNVKQTTKN